MIIENEYLRRNLIVSKSVGVKSGIDYALVRLSNVKKRPKWLFDLLGREYVKMDEIIAVEWLKGRKK